MSNIIKFAFESLEVRTVVEGSEVWFIAQDVARALGYEQTSSMNKLIDSEDKKKITLQNGGNYQNQSLINESGLYQAIFNSTLPAAKRFKKWVTSEVLPSIRKTGGYSSTLPDFTNPADAARAWAIEYEAKQAALAENAKLNTIIDNEFGYSSILRAAAYAGVHEKTFDCRTLKGTTLGLGLKVKQVPSPRYAYQNLYPIKAFEMVYPDIDFDDLKQELIDNKAQLAIKVMEHIND